MVDFLGFVCVSSGVLLFVAFVGAYIWVRWL